MLGAASTAPATCRRASPARPGSGCSPPAECGTNVPRPHAYFQAATIRLSLAAPVMPESSPLWNIALCSFGVTSEQSLG